jgi:hypothetical protein
MAKITAAERKDLDILYRPIDIHNERTMLDNGIIYTGPMAASMIKDVVPGQLILCSTGKLVYLLCVDKYIGDSDVKWKNLYNGQWPFHVKVKNIMSWKEDRKTFKNRCLGRDKESRKSCLKISGKDVIYNMLKRTYRDATW